MRTVVSPEEVAHFWANQTQSHARNKQGNISFSGREIRSYSTAMGYIHPSGLICLNVANYSHTTNRHQRCIAQAIPQYKQADVVRANTASVHDPLLVACALDTELHATMTKLLRARSNAPTLAAYCLEGYRARICKEMRKRYVPAYVPGADIKVVVDKWIAAAERYKAKKAREEAKARAARVLELAEDKAAWLAGTGNSLVWANYESYCHLRINPADATEVETSRRARCPLRHVRRIAPYVLQLLASGGTYKANGHTVHFGPYQLDEITAAGEGIAGCHHFQKAEVERFGALLMALPEPAPEVETPAPLPVEAPAAATA